MKKTIVLILCLTLISLACVTSATIAETILTATAEATIETPAQVATMSAMKCARVVAVEALHLRKGPSENDIVLAWLKHDDLVQVIDQSNADWWRIEVNGVVGFARAKYLQIGAC